MTKRYTSNKPTKEKKKLFWFMERTKDDLGYIPFHKVESYSEKRGFKIKRKYDNTFYIKNKRSTTIARVDVYNRDKGKKDEKRRIFNWGVR